MNYKNWIYIWNELQYWNGYLLYMFKWCIVIYRLNEIKENKEY